jgi:tRNA dimethylallyltransferase
MQGKIIVIVGATASGKSAYALKIAEQVKGVIINGDSMQVYKELPILTAQPDISMQSQIPHKLYGIIRLNDHFSVAKWLELVKAEIESAKEKGLTPIIVGGSGLYLKSLIDGLAEIPDISKETKSKVQTMTLGKSNEEIHTLLKERDFQKHAFLKVNDIKRITRALEVYEQTGMPLSEWQLKPHKPIFPTEDFFSIHINPTRETIYANCDRRLEIMVKIGALDEVNKLLNGSPSLDLDTVPKILGIRELASYIIGELSLDSAIKKAQQVTRNYAKRQLTWFRHQMRYNLVIDHLQ